MRILRSSRLRAARSAVALAAMSCVAAQAFTIDTGEPDVTARWDNTFKYSTGVRLKSPSTTLTGSSNPNLDDGDRNFKKGLISNRVDWLSEFDLSYHGVGARVSTAAWYDTVYNTHTDNDTGFSNSTSVPASEFTSATRNLHGRKGELLDAFLFGKTELGTTSLSGRFGRHTVLWGESLFFGSNGIAGTQAPVDIVKLLSVPGSQFKELVRPTNQMSGQWVITPEVSLGAYLQFSWERNRIPAAGSYFSRADLFDAGGERQLLPPFLGGPVNRGADIKPSNSGQGGLQLRYRAASIDTDFGLYATRFHDKDFQVQLRPGVDYSLVFHQGVRAFGASFSKSVGEWNLAGEVSTRRNTALVAAGGLVVGAGDNHDNPLYPIGNTGHAQISAVHTLERSPLWDGGLLLAEVAWHRRLSVLRNDAALDPNTTRDAAALRLILSPTFYQAWSGVDLSVPVGWGANFKGRSSVFSVWNGGYGPGAGDLSIGLSAEVMQTWKASVNFTHYYGSSDTILDATNHYSFKQSLKDRDFVSLSVQRTF